MTHPSSPPAPMTAERYSIERIRRAQILEPVGAQQFAQHTYASDIRALLEQYDALTARVAHWQSVHQTAAEANERLRAELAAARKVEDGEVEEALGWLDKPQLYPSGRIKKIAALVRQLYAALKEAERRETEAKTLQHQLASDLTVVVARAQAAEAKLYAAMDALTFILPLAKGYAHEHPVGANQRHVDEAAETLRALQTKDTTL